MLNTGENTADRPTSIDDMLKKAFLLAYFIHGDKQTAVRIVSGAMAKLDVAATAQGKRLYYKPASRSLLRRSKVDQFRSKVTFSELHLLQRLIYIESEPYEKQIEQRSRGATVRKEDLLVHFIKHLVRITLKRNSFYVTLGMSRLLYNYTTSETMGIYNVVVQDPERVKDDYYYRSRKGVLMQEIKERFGDLVRISHGQRGEERFQAEPEPGRFAGLVGECLSVFTPWATPCLVPAGFDPITETIPSLLFQSKDNEDKIEVNRIHAALHPDCYQRLVRALGFHSPDQRLEVPHFFLSHEKGDRNEGRRDRHSNLELGGEDLNTIKHDLGELEERRKRASAGLLRILIDGVECARMDLDRERRVSVDLERENELIEIWTADEAGDLLLASHLLIYQEPEAARPLQASIVLAGGQKLSMLMSPPMDAKAAVVEIRYQETNPIKKAAIFLGQTLEPLVARPRTFSGDESLLSAKGPSKVLLPVLISLLFLIAATVVVRYLQRRGYQAEPPAVTDSKHVQPLTADVDPASDKQPANANTTTAEIAPGVNADRNPGRIAERSADGRTPSAQPPVNQGIASPDREGPSLANEKAPATVEQQGGTDQVSREAEATRALQSEDAPMSLVKVKNVYVEVLGEESSSQLVNRMVVRQLQLSGRFALKNRDEADALLKVVVKRVPATARMGRHNQVERLALVVQLLNASGNVIWPLSDRSSRSYSGLTADQVSAQVIKDLLHDIEYLERRH